MENNRILSALNHGYRTGHSCEKQLLTTVDDKLHTLDRELQTDIAILDFSKAFDTVPHRELLYNSPTMESQDPFILGSRTFSLIAQ